MPDATTLSPSQIGTLLSQQKNFLYGVQMKEYATQAPAFTHAGQWWVRFSAQIYNTVDDFERVAMGLKEICERMEKGEHLL